ncbi:hypothetical protein B0H15DRAFT_860855 [Mycena belliarum]|uniref:Uncharacterized protein n=1 Tax=Mycena belliarum TaxID=1033014 RepID=A0AAD6TXP2_9AGAR|nr:hypothetical protein B0H15DRAFT_860855 [Mycena belliae]
MRLRVAMPGRCADEVREAPECGARRAADGPLAAEFPRTQRWAEAQCGGVHTSECRDAVRQNGCFLGNPEDTKSRGHERIGCAMRSRGFSCVTIVLSWEPQDCVPRARDPECPPPPAVADTGCDVCASLPSGRVVALGVRCSARRIHRMCSTRSPVLRLRFPGRIVPLGRHTPYRQLGAAGPRLLVSLPRASWCTRSMGIVPFFSRRPLIPK